MIFRSCPEQSLIIYEGKQELVVTEAERAAREREKYRTWRERKRNWRRCGPMLINSTVHNKTEALISMSESTDMKQYKSSPLYVDMVGCHGLLFFTIYGQAQTVN